MMVIILCSQFPTMRLSHLNTIPKYRGFTLVEGLVTIAILGIVSVFAISAWGSFTTKKNVYAMIETLDSKLKIARSESLAKHKSITIAFRKYQDNDNHWCYGLSDNGNCDCRTSNDCTIDETAVIFDNSETLADLTLTDLEGDADTPYIQFEPIRGTIATPATIEISYQDITAKVNLSILGLPQHCSDQLPNYPSC